jgi:exodeoxyribonuclease V beta subunit
VRIYQDCDGYVRGYIDLIFQFKERYFIADWKSNYLADGYSQRALKKSMDQANYHLQYRIYALALLRWLAKAFGNPSKVVDLFGGVFYFYLRGMGGEDQNGVYFVPSSKLGSRDMLEKELVRNLRRTSN